MDLKTKKKWDQINFASMIISMLALIISAVSTGIGMYQRHIENCPLHYYKNGTEITEEAFYRPGNALGTSWERECR